MFAFKNFRIIVDPYINNFFKDHDFYNSSFSPLEQLLMCIGKYETYGSKCILERTHFPSQFTSINSLFKSPPRKLSSSTPPTPFLCQNLIGGSVSLIALHIFIYCILLHEQRLLNTLLQSLENGRVEKCFKKVDKWQKRRNIALRTITD